MPEGLQPPAEAAHDSGVFLLWACVVLCAALVAVVTLWIRGAAACDARVTSQSIAHRADMKDHVASLTDLLTRTIQDSERYRALLETINERHKTLTEVIERLKERA